MFKALLLVQWKWTKGAALLAVIVAFALPLASVRVMGTRVDYAFVDYSRAASVVNTMQEFGVAYSLLAALVGLAFAMLAWHPDHQGRHVYALSLPIDRSRYATMRFAAGALFLLLPALVVMAGSLVAVAIADIPLGLHAYPLSLAFRFLLASAVAYAIFFAVTASTSKAAGVILGGLASILIIAFILSATSIDVDVLGRVANFVFGEAGPLAVFTGRWMLFDA